MEEKLIEEVKPILALPMQEQRKPLLKDLNNFLMCRLCGGYLVEATSLVECLHTYCRSCIVQFLQISKSCPICETQVSNKTNPFLSLRPDKIIQRLVYKTVPGLYKNELQRRQKYVRSPHNDEKMKNQDDKMSITFQEDFSSNDEYYFSPEELISISLEYVEENRNDNFKIFSTDTNIIKSEAELTKFDEKTEQITHRRYLQCPAAVKIDHIHKFIKLKYNLQNNHEVEISYENVRLPNYLSLMDTAYMFSWNREKPMRLCYQILERTFIQVPVVISNKIPDDFVPSVKNSTYLKHSLSNINLTLDSMTQTNVKQGNNEVDGSTSKNMKRKAESVNKVLNETEKSDEKFEFREPSIKIPRIESSATAAEMKETEEVTKSSPSKSPLHKIEDDRGTHEGMNSTSKTTSPKMPENFADYEQDIEEVVEEDDEGDDNEGRLCISQPSDEEVVENKPDDNNIEHLIIDTSDNEKMQEDTYEEDRKVKYKRKNKKSKHHHHRKHRHHERKKNATQATILHSPDADSGIILKLKLSNHHTSLDSKHHKQSKRKHKKNSESYFSSFSSSSSVSSLPISSPEPNIISRADEDSSHSQISESSADCISEKSSLKEEAPKNELFCPSPVSPMPVTKGVVAPMAEKEVDKHKVQGPNADKSLIVRSSQSKNEFRSSSNKMNSELKSPCSKEKLIPMRNLRPKNIAIVRPEEHIDENDTKNDDNNNDKLAPILTTELEKPEPAVTEVCRPTSSSALTVSKITAAEMKKEQEKLQLFNGSKEGPPALEITVVSSGKGTGNVSPPKLSESASVTIRPSKPVPKPIKPIPAAIPLLQYQKMKSSEQQTNSNGLPKLTEHNLPKSLTITPHVVTSTQRNLKLNGNVPNKKIRDMCDSKLDGMRQSVTISLSENDSALDLSGVPKHQVTHLQNKKLQVASPQGIRMNGVPMHYGAHMNKKSVNESVVYPLQKLPELHHSSKTNGLQYPAAALSVMPPSMSKNMKVPSPFASTILRSQVPIRSNAVRTANKNEEERGRKVNNLPQLTEIKKGPPSKPGPNQNVRSIPNLSTILQRQQSISNFPVTSPEVAMMHRVMSSMCSFGNSKKTLEKCPPSVPINNAYLDHANLMVTK